MDLQNGLSQKEAHLRLAKFGPNQIKSPTRVTMWRLLFAQFKSPLVYLLVFFVPLLLLVGQPIDAGMISVAVIFNISLAFVQEFRTAWVMESLNRLVKPTAKVKREGKWTEIDARFLVTGDIVRLEIGQSVPADGILIVEDGVYLNEAILTGESIQVHKKAYTGHFEDQNLSAIYDYLDESYRCLAGTTVDRGIGEMLVVWTGSRTRMGHIAHLVDGDAHRLTPLQHKLQTLSHQLGIIVSLVIALVIVIGIYRGLSWSTILPLAVALAVSGIPEGLVISVTIGLTLGMQKILKHKALVRKLVAAETLGQVDVICLDKTGTLTEGKMTSSGGVTNPALDLDHQLVTPKLQDQDKLLWVARGSVLCNDFRDPLEIAMNDWALKYLKAKSVEDVQKKFPRTDELPFDPKFKYIVTRHRLSKGLVEFISGAPEVILNQSRIDAKLKQAWIKQFDEVGKRGYRMVGFAYKKVTGEKITRTEVGEYQWLGIVVFVDPIREGVSQSLHRAQSAGINLKVITGDYKETAWSVLQQVGVTKGPLDLTKIVTGDELKQLEGEELIKRVNQAILFARTTPEQKLAIVDALQRGGHVVAMMGDGVNDAPAIKQADIGIVVGKASDVARETADLILLDNNFHTILMAVEEGRAIFENIRKVILYLLADAYAAVLITLVSIIFAWPLPMLALQILWITFIHDGFPYLALLAEPRSQDLLGRKPLKPSDQIVNQTIFKLIGLVALVAGTLGLGTFAWHFFYLHHSVALARSATMLTFGFCTLAFAFSARVLDRPIWSESFWRNRWLIVAVGMGIVLQLMVLYIPFLTRIFQTVPLDLSSWLGVVTAFILMIVFTEIGKIFLFGIRRAI